MIDPSDVLNLFIRGIITGGALGASAWMIGYAISAIIKIIRRS